MKQFIIFSGIVLSLLGYGAGHAGSGAGALLVDGVGQSRSLFLWVLGVVGPLTGAGLFIAVYTEKRRVKRQMIVFNSRLDEFRKSIRRDGKFR